MAAKRWWSVAVLVEESDGTIVLEHEAVTARSPRKALRKVLRVSKNYNHRWGAPINHGPACVMLGWDGIPRRIQHYMRTAPLAGLAFAEVTPGFCGCWFY